MQRNIGKIYFIIVAQSSDDSTNSMTSYIVCSSWVVAEAPCCKLS